jgi:hypothetical protein
MSKIVRTHTVRPLFFLPFLRITPASCYRSLIDRAWRLTQMDVVSTSQETAARTLDIESTAASNQDMASSAQQATVTTPTEPRDSVGPDCIQSAVSAGACAPSGGPKRPAAVDADADDNDTNDGNGDDDDDSAAAAAEVPAGLEYTTRDNHFTSEIFKLCIRNIGACVRACAWPAVLGACVRAHVRAHLPPFVFAARSTSCRLDAPFCKLANPHMCKKEISSHARTWPTRCFRPLAHIDRLPTPRNALTTPPAIASSDR